MSTMTFRARDNATALELVERRFGGDALILSTVYVDGRVEITATDEAPPPANSDYTQRRPYGSRIDVLVDDPVEPDPRTPPAPTPSPVLTSEPTPEPASDPPARNPDLPKFLDPKAPRSFEAALQQAQEAPVSAAAPQPVPEHDIAAPRRDPALLRTALLGAARIVLVGPCGAGKTQVALQLALLRRAQNPHVPISFVFCGTGSRADGAVLAQKSHLLGMKTHFKKPADLEAPSRDGTEIIVISGRSNVALDEARSLLAGAETKALLVLPDGLRTDRVARLATYWQGVTSWAALGHVAPADMAEIDAPSFAQNDLDLLWASAPDTLVDGLCPMGLGGRAAAVSPRETATVAALEPLSAETDAQVVFRRHQKELEARP